MEFKSLLPQPLAKRWTKPQFPHPNKPGTAHIHPRLFPSRKCDDSITSFLLQRLEASLRLKWQHLTDKGTDQEETLSILYSVIISFFSIFQMNSRDTLNSGYFLGTTVKYQCTKQLHANQGSVYQRPATWVHEKARCNTSQVSAPDC